MQQGFVPDGVVRWERSGDTITLVWPTNYSPPEALRAIDRALDGAVTARGKWAVVAGLTSSSGKKWERRYGRMRWSWFLRTVRRPSVNYYRADLARRDGGEPLTISCGQYGGPPDYMVTVGAVGLTLERALPVIEATGNEAVIAELARLRQLPAD